MAERERGRFCAMSEDKDKEEEKEKPDKEEEKECYDKVWRNEGGNEGNG